MSGCRHLKAAGDILDYPEDWAGWLAGDTIDTSGWSVSDPALVIDSDDVTAATTTVWLSGGNQGRRYTVTNTITTTGGRTASRSITVIVHQL